MPEVADKTPHQQLIEQKPVQPGTEDLSQVPEDFAGFSKWRAEGGTPEVTPAPSTEEKPADAPEPSKAEQEKADDRDDKGRFKPKESEVPVGVQKRIDKAIAKQRDAERRAQELEERLKKYEVPQVAKPAAVPEVKPVDGKPKLENFGTYDEYVEALVDFKATEKLAAERTKEAETRKQQESEKEITAKQTKWRQSEEAARAKYKDYDEALAETPDVPQHLLFAVLESDSQAELAYYLAKNSAELDRLTSVPVQRLGYEIGKIEAKLATPAPVAQPKTTTAPPPPSPVQARATGSSFSENDEGGTADEWARKRNEQVHKRRR